MLCCPSLSFKRRTIRYVSLLCSGNITLSRRLLAYHSKKNSFGHLSNKIDVSTTQTARSWRALAPTTLQNLRQLNPRHRQSDMLRTICKEGYSDTRLGSEVAPAPKAYVHPSLEVGRHSVTATHHTVKLLRRRQQPQVTPSQSLTQIPRIATSLQSRGLRCT